MVPDHLRIGFLFISDWDCVYTALHEFDTLCSNNPEQLCSASAGSTNVNLVQSVPLCFKCKHRNAIRNAPRPRPRFDNRMASVQVILSIAWQIGKGNNKYGRRNKIILARDSVPGLFSSLCINVYMYKCINVYTFILQDVLCTGFRKAIRHEINPISFKPDLKSVRMQPNTVSS